MSSLALYLFGQPRIERDGEPIKADRRKAIALLVYLADAVLAAIEKPLDAAGA